MSAMICNSLGSFRSRIKDSSSKRFGKGPCTTVKCVQTSLLLVSGLLIVSWTIFSHQFSLGFITSCLERNSPGKRIVLNVLDPNNLRNAAKVVAHSYADETDFRGDENSRKIGGEFNMTGNPRIFYSTVRADRSGAVIIDMLLAHAMTYLVNSKYGGACIREYSPYVDQTEDLIKAIGLEDVLVFACPEDENLMLDRWTYASLNTYLFTEDYLNYLRPLVNPRVKQKGGGAVIHMRRGDVSPCGQYSNRYLPNSYYKQILSEYVPSGTAVSILSESKSVETFDDFQNYTLHLDTDLVEAWKVLVSADYIVLSRSSFSFVPAMLNGNAKILYAPFMHRPLPGWITVKSPFLFDALNATHDIIVDRCEPPEREVGLLALDKLRRSLAIEYGM